MSDRHKIFPYETITTHGGPDELLAARISTKHVTVALMKSGRIHINHDYHDGVQLCIEYESAEHLVDEVHTLHAERDRLREALRLRTQDEWHDECGDVIWWGDREEAYQSAPWYMGSPLCDDPHGCVYSSDAVWLPLPQALEGEG